MNKLKKWLKDTLTEPDNETICPIRIFAIVGFLYALICHAWSVFALDAAFDLQSFGLGFGTMLVTCGAALGIKSDTPKKD